VIFAVPLFIRVTLPYIVIPSVTVSELVDVLIVIFIGLVFELLFDMIEPLMIKEQSVSRNISNQLGASDMSKLLFMVYVEALLTAI